MKRKEVKIQVPEGYEIDRENSTFECIKFKSMFKSIKRYITYKDICNSILETGYYINSYGEIVGSIIHAVNLRTGKNNATNAKQIKRLLALNQLLNIAVYYNRKSKITNKLRYKITYIEYTGQYDIHFHNVGDDIKYGISALFNRKEDAQSVIDNPNFREILDIIYKI